MSNNKSEPNASFPYTCLASVELTWVETTWDRLELNVKEEQIQAVRTTGPLSSQLRTTTTSRFDSPPSEEEPEPRSVGLYTHVERQAVRRTELEGGLDAFRCEADRSSDHALGRFWISQVSLNVLAWTLSGPEQVSQSIPHLAGYWLVHFNRFR